MKNHSQAFAGHYEINIAYVICEGLSVAWTVENTRQIMSGILKY